MGIRLGWGWRMGGGNGKPRVCVVGNSGTTRRGSKVFIGISFFLYFGLSRLFIVHVLTDTHQLERKLHMIIYQEFIVGSFGLGGLEKVSIDV